MKSHIFIFRALAVFVLMATSAFSVSFRGTDCRVETDDPACNDGDVYNGYWWREEIFVPGMITVERWFSPAPIVSYGSAVFYDPYVMGATAEYRGMNLDGYKGGVAMMSPADIGLPVWIKVDGHNWDGPYLVVDCARRADIYALTISRGEVVEFSFATAEKYGMVERTSPWDYDVLNWRLNNVIVSKVPPTVAAYVDAVYYPNWFLDNIEYTPRWEKPPVFKRGWPREEGEVWWWFGTSDHRFYTSPIFVIPIERGPVANP